MIYLDTSVVVALLTPEERSAQALDWFAQSRDPLISSDWLITETHSTLGIKQRHHGLSSQARQAAGQLRFANAASRDCPRDEASTGISQQSVSGPAGHALACRHRGHGVLLVIMNNPAQPFGPV
jgi:predicted nucleic acid-binding protein